jgi:hypothetical protein
MREEGYGVEKLREIGKIHGVKNSVLRNEGFGMESSPEVHVNAYKLVRE